ncbi:MAG TPA: cytochrome b [Pseudolabrys sp.]|nr:cytochrome b [Pseudolabrys sp.]
MEDKSASYNGTARTLHWLILALLIAQFIFAWTMPHIGRVVPKSVLIDLHVWFGVTILFVAVIRLAWRLTHREPEPEDGLPPWQVVSARIIHWLLYVLLFVVPLLGWFNASWRGMTVSFFTLFDLPQLIGTRVGSWGWTGDIHGFLADYALLGLVGLHVAAALYHYFIRRDRVLQRMLPGV